MKGTLVIDGKIVVCEIAGESWKQGQQIQGSVSAAGINKLRVLLTRATIKKVQSRDAKAFTVLEEIKCNDGDTFNFDLSIDAEVTDKKDAYYLLFGKSEELTKLSSMQLNIAPNDVINNFLKVIDTFFRFKVKEYKTAKKGFVEFKMIPPAAKDYQLIDSLVISMKYIEKNMHLKYDFKVKKMDYSDITPKTKLVNKKYDFELNPRDFIMFKEEVDQDKIIKHFQAIIDEVKKNQI